MAVWPNARALSVGFAFGHTQYEDPTAVPFEVVSPGGAATDPGPVLDGFVIQRGRIGDAAETQTTDITLSMRNNNGEFSPRNAMGPRYGTLRRGTPMQIRLDTGAGPTPLATANALGFNPIRSGPNVDPLVSVQGLGVLNRMGRDGVEASAMRRYYDQVSPQPVAYWSLELGDRRGALSFQSALSGGADLVVTQSTNFGVTRPFSAAGGVTPGPLGAASATDTSAGGYLIGDVQVVGGATTARIEMSMLANGFENTFPGLLGLRNTLTSAFGSACNMDIVAQLFGSDWKIGALWNGPSGSADSYTSSPVVLQDNQWHLLQLDQSSAGGGANTAWVIRLDGVVILSGTATGYTWAPPKQMLLNDLATDIDRVAHVAVWSGASLPSAADSYQAFLGRPNEMAHARIASMCSQVGIPYTSTATASAALGAQPTGTALAVLRDCEDADMGVLYERRDGRLTYRPMGDRYNAPIALTLAYKDIPGAVPNDDDRDVYNRIKLTRPDGEFATAEQASGPVGSSTTTGVGPRPASVPRNLFSSTDLAAAAGWLLRIKTIDRARFIVVIDLTAVPSLAASVVACDIGSRIKVTGGPAEDFGADALDLIIEGEQITCSGGKLVVQWYCEPYEPWRVQQLVGTAPSTFDGRYAGADAAALTAGIPAGATSITFDPAGSRWVTNPVQDTFEGRTVAGAWGTPTIGAAWSTLFTSGGTVVPSVSGGDGVMTVGTANNSGAVAAGVSLADVRVWARSLRPNATPSGATVESTIWARATGGGAVNIAATITWNTGGTATLEVSDTTAGTLATVAVPGVTTSQPIDVVVQAVGTTVRVWVALASTGVNLNAVPLATVTTTVAAAGDVAVFVFGSTSLVVPRAIQLGEIHVLSPGTYPDDFPLNARLGGELVTVTQIVDSGANQIATATRSVNGVVKSHPAGELIAVEDVLIWAL